MYVKRWRPETHAFHFPTGECTIMLEDVYMLLGLPIGGQVVTGPPSLSWQTCYDLLGVIIPQNKKEGHSILSPPKIRIQYARRYLLWLIGGFLFPNTTGMYVHNSWLSLLVDFNQTRTYSWGSAVLAFLYCGMCEASHPTKKGLPGCNFLLQVWGYCRDVTSSNSYRFPQESEHWDNRRQHTLPRQPPRTLLLTPAYIHWFTNECNHHVKISIQKVHEEVPQ